MRGASSIRKNSTPRMTGGWQPADARGCMSSINAAVLLRRCPNISGGGAQHGGLQKIYTRLAGAQSTAGERGQVKIKICIWKREHADDYSSDQRSQGRCE